MQDLLSEARDSFAWVDRIKKHSDFLRSVPLRLPDEVASIESAVLRDKYLAEAVNQMAKEKVGCTPSQAALSHGSRHGRLLGSGPRPGWFASCCQARNNTAQRIKASHYAGPAAPLVCHPLPVAVDNVPT